MKQPKRANREIIQAIMEEADVKIARAYQMIEEVKRSKAVDVRTAANYVAAQLGVDVQKRKYGLTEVDKEKLRQLLGGTQPIIAVGTVGQKGKERTQVIPVQIGSRVTETLMLTPGFAKEAVKMSRVYSIVYVLENSLRHLIKRTLEDKYGSDWWNKATISSDTKTKVEKRLKQEDENRWHSRRGSHRVFYTDFNDLGAIMINNWSEFKNVFKKQHLLQTRFEEIELSRNIVAHSNPLPDNEVKRLELNFNDWKSMLRESTRG